MKSLLKESKSALRKYRIEFNQELRRNKERANGTAVLLSRLPDYSLPTNATYRPLFGGVEIRIPRVQSEINRFREYVATLNEDEFTVEERDYSKLNGDFDFNIRTEHAVYWSFLRVSFKVEMEGATCELIKIGEESYTSTRPVYEVVCTEGAQEAVL